MLFFFVFGSFEATNLTFLSKPLPIWIRWRFFGGKTSHKLRKKEKENKEKLLIISRNFSNIYYQKGDRITRKHVIAFIF